MTAALHNRGGNNIDLPLLLSEVVKLVQPMFPFCFLDHAARRDSQVTGRTGCANMQRICAGAIDRGRLAESLQATQARREHGAKHGRRRSRSWKLQTLQDD